MIEQTYTIRADAALCIAVVSDLHGRDGTEVLQSLRARKPDVIAIPGDFVLGKRPREHDRLLDVPIVRYQTNVLPFLERSSEIAQTFVSLGNHEALLDEEDLELVRATGISLLDNSFRRFRGDVVIGGLTSGRVTNYRAYKKARFGEHGCTERYPSRGPREMPKWFDVEDAWLTEFQAQEGYKILLSHHPEYWCLREPHLSEQRIDLVLSGHAHGGQMRIGSQGLYAPGQGLFPRYTKGVWAGKHGRLVISAGLSNTAKPLPRLLNPTEVVYVELK